jgi:hypothetical protein
MSQVKLQGGASGTGSVTLLSPNTNGDYTVTVPAGTGTMVVSGASSAITSGTAVASTSGTSIDFTGIPSWVKRITVMFNGVSSNGTTGLLLQIGAGSLTTSGYSSTSWNSSASVSTSGFLLSSALSSAPYTQTGVFVLCLIGSNTWVGFGNTQYANVTSLGFSSAGNSSALGGTLDRVRITTVNGTDTFDAGSINILYE